MDVLIQVLRGRVVIQAEQGYLKRGSMVKEYEIGILIRSFLGQIRKKRKT